MKKRVKNRYLVLLLICIVLIPLIATFWFNKVVDESSNVAFETHVTKESQGLQGKLEAYSNILYSLRGLFVVDQEITKQDWDTYIASMALQDRYPGVTGVGYIKKVLQEEVIDYEQYVLEQYPDSDLGQRESMIFPKSNSEEFYPLTFFSPNTDYKAFVGYDIGLESERKSALDKAATSGTLVATKPVKLLSDPNGANSFIIYMPIYKNGVDIEDSILRSEAIEGFVSIAIKVPDLIDGVIWKYDSSEALQLRIADITGGDASDEIEYFYESDGFSKLDLASGKFLEKTIKFEIAQREWVFDFKAQQDYSLLEVRQNMRQGSILLVVPLIMLMAFCLYKIIHSLAKDEPS